MALLFVIIDELMEDNFDADENDDFPFLASIQTLNIRRQIVPKVHGFVEEVIPLYNGQDFKHDFRISRANYGYLLGELTSSIKYEDRAMGREALAPNKQLLIFLWYMANKDSMREMGRLFGVSRFTVHKCVRRISKAICETLLDQLISWPDHDRQAQISASIYCASRIRNCTGFIDGTHIRMSSISKDDKKSYFNRKGFPSVLLQLVVTDELLIIDSLTGWPGSTHDARVYKNSPLYQRLTRDGTCLAPGNFIIGDGAYPLSTFMMTPFKQIGNLTCAEKHYNTKVSSARQAVERAIGHLKGRFRRLMDLDCRNIQNACYIITSACILHNLCIVSRDDIGDYFQEGSSQNPPVNDYPPVFTNSAAGIQKRNELVQYLQEFVRPQ